MWKRELRTVALSAAVAAAIPAVGHAAAEVVIDGTGVGCSSAGIWYADHVRCELQRSVRGVDIVADGVTLDCRGHVVDGAGRAAGIRVSGRSKVTVKGCRVQRFDEGIVFEDTVDGQIEDNILTGNVVAGIAVRRSKRTVIARNSGAANGAMCRMDSSHDGVIEDNSSAAQDGFFVVSSDGNVFRRNFVSDAPRAGFVAVDSSENRFSVCRAVTSIGEVESVGFGFEDGFDNVVEDSHAKGFTVCYGARGSHGITIEGNEGHECRYGTAIDGVDYATVRENIYTGGDTAMYGSGFFFGDFSDNTATQSGTGFHFEHGSDSTITDNEAIDTEVGMYVAYVDYLVVTGNVTKTARIGSQFEYGSNLTIKNNRAEGSEWHGVGITRTTLSLVSANETSDGGVGFLVSLSHGNDVRRNRSTRNDTGFYADGDSADNTFAGNVTRDSRSYGFVDTSRGAKTAGTKNKYKSNRCSGNGIAGSSPEGLCRAR